MTIWYDLGTVEATNGSTTITGALTAWLAMAKPGDEIYFDADARGYEVISIASNTSMEISPAYAGTTGSGKTYRLKPIGPGWNSVTELSTSVAELLTLVGNEITNGIGIPSNDGGNDGDTYIRTDVPSIYAKESGTWVLKATISGPTGDPGPSYQATSTSSVAIGTGSKSFTLVETGRGYTVGQRLRVTSSASTSNYMEGLVTSYSSPTLVINVDRVGGSGTIASWNINITGDPGPANSLSIGTVEQGSAAASITGDAPTQTLNLVLPKGDAATIEVGDVTTVDPGDPATVTNSGTSAEAVFDFEIPRGAPGVSVTHRGDYDSGTEYAFNDQVLESGSTWQYVHAEPSSGNAPPTLPTTANDHWQLSSRRGVDGTGAVNTVNSEAPDIDGDVTISAANIAVPHTPVNFEPEGASINDFIAAIDARLGDAADVGVIEWTTVTSASTVDLSVVTTEGVVITGTTTITTLTMAPNSRKTIRFTGALVLTHHATALILPGGANIASAAGDTALIVAGDDTNARCVAYQRAALAPYKLPTRQIFVTSGTWTRPLGCKLIRVTVLGGGGGGGGGDGASSQASIAGGGASGGFAIKWIDVTAISSVSVTVGALGAGGAAGANDGTTGGTSSFGAHCSATGGEGGSSSAAAATPGAQRGGNGGTGTNGDINGGGAVGASGIRLSGTASVPGTGASSIMGGGGQWAGNASGGSATGFGAGGAAGHSNNTTDRAGGDGTPGIVIVEEFY